MPEQRRRRLALWVSGLSVAIGAGALALYFFGGPYWIVLDERPGESAVWFFGPDDRENLVWVLGSAVLVVGGAIALVAMRRGARSRRWRLLTFALAGLAPLLAAFVAWEMLSARQAAHRLKEGHPGSRVVRHHWGD